jgi:co-chaperonin GroES (HSP10)
MRALFFLMIAVFAAPALTLGQATQGSDPSITATHVIGEVKSIDANAKQLTVKTDAGSVVTVVLNDATTYMRLPPGETTMAKATKIAFGDIGEGDRVLANGKVSDDHKNVTSKALVVMTKADITKKQEQERQEWRRRGILGVIASLKADTKEITITTTTRTPAGPQQQPVIIPVSDKVDLKRYAPDSIKFSDAKASSFGELQVGDQVRALGEKSEDGTHFTPERIVTGSFRTVAGTVTSVDAASGEIKINDLQTKKALIVVVKNDSVLRKFEMGGGMMGGRGPGAGGPGAGGAGNPQGGGQGGGQAANRPAGGGGTAPGGGPGGGGPGGGGGGRFGGGFNIQDMLDRMPTISLADVKQGDTIIVSSTKGADPSRLTAITLVNGAETILAMLAPRPQQGQAAAPNPAAGLGSGINFGIGLP